MKWKNIIGSVYEIIGMSYFIVGFYGLILGKLAGVVLCWMLAIPISMYGTKRQK